jgi:aspartate/tyrosine/aromatic aminotransferase
MFETLSAGEPDAILALIGEYREDKRPGKLDLGVGVYKDETGSTPVMRAVRKAETRQIADQETKTYLGLAGDAAFNKAITEVALGKEFDDTRLRAIQTPGGSGAIRILSDLLAHARSKATIWVSDPTWANHVPTFEAAGLVVRSYPYFDVDSGQVRFDAMMELLRTIPPGDIVLLHGCCHNPTGANLTFSQWEAVTNLIVECGLFPFVDMAYQGFGEGLDEDAAGVRHLAKSVPEMVLAVSCSKNFAVYCDRVGAAMVVGRNSAEADNAVEQLKTRARQSYSMPPNHGAAAVRMVLCDHDLRAEWLAELEGMRTRMLRLRSGLADALRRHSNSDRFDFLADHRGMFSRLGLTRSQVDWLREEHGIYMVGDSRINVAGLPDAHLDELATKIIAATKI